MQYSSTVSLKVPERLLGNVSYRILADLGNNFLFEVDLTEHLDVLRTALLATTQFLEVQESDRCAVSCHRADSHQSLRVGEEGGPVGNTLLRLSDASFFPKQMPTELQAVRDLLHALLGLNFVACFVNRSSNVDQTIGSRRPPLGRMLNETTRTWILVHFPSMQAREAVFLN
jgi:hypothetical protein